MDKYVSTETLLRVGIAAAASITSAALTKWWTRDPSQLQLGGDEAEAEGVNLKRNRQEWKVVSHNLLRNFCQKVFEHYGINPEDAALAADVLVTADLRGIESHGIARLQAYTELLGANRINVNPRIKIVSDQPGFAIVDGDNGLGLVVAPKANDMAIERAKKYGCGAVGIRNTNHFGIAAYYTLQAADKGCIGTAMTNSTPLVAAHGGKGRVLGTNPLAATFPAHRKEDRVTVDMASSAVAYGKVEIKNRSKQGIPWGWAIDKDGHDTLTPQGMMDDGALLPLGSDNKRSGHKGYCLASMVDIFSGVLTGANYGPFTPPFTLNDSIAKSTTETQRVGEGIGHFFTVYNLSDGKMAQDFTNRLQHWSNTMKNSNTRPGVDRVRVPGDPEEEAYASRIRGGIAIHPSVYKDLQAISAKTGVSLLV